LELSTGNVEQHKGRENKKMNKLILKLKIWKDQSGQDLIEYALMAGFVAVAAGAIMPGVAQSISVIFSKVSSVMTAASNT
jgi:pilus assembly protein Flp/PilA